MWAQVGKTYEIKKEVGYYNNSRYLERVRRKHPNWNWRGVNDGRWRPPLTQQSDLLSSLSAGTKFKVTEILYQAISENMRYQAVKAELVGESFEDEGFIWLWHQNVKNFDEIPIETAPDGSEYKRHEITDDELINGLRLNWRYEWVIVFPAMKIIINFNSKSYSDSDKFTLYGYDEKNNVEYEKTLTAKDDLKDNNGVKELVFQGTPKRYKYTLEYEPAKLEEDEAKTEKPRIEIFSKRDYTKVLSV